MSRFYKDAKHLHGQSCTECDNAELDVHYNRPGGSNHYWGLSCLRCGLYWHYSTYDHAMRETTREAIEECVAPYLEEEKKDEKRAET